MKYRFMGFDPGCGDMAATIVCEVNDEGIIKVISCDTRKPIPEDPDEAYMMQLESECYAQRDAFEQALFAKAVGRALIDRCKPCDWGLNWFQRLWYTAKVLICMLLRLEYDPRIHGDYPENIDVAIVEYNKLYAGWECETLQVGWDQWWYRIEHDSDWNM